MSSFQWLCLSMRVIGVWNFVDALGYFTACFNAAYGYYASTTQPIGFFFQGLVHLVAALLLVRAAPFFASFAYPKPRSSSVVEDKNDREDI